MESLVTAEQVTKTFGDVRAVDSLSFAVPQGAIYGFIGPNGSGKTTTLRLLMNIFTPDNGRITMFDNHSGEVATERIGYLPEERGLYKKMKVRDVLRFYGELRAGRSVGDEVDYWLEKLRLSEWAARKVETLSKGMSQKVQFISAVVPRPELLILDEPFAGLDPVNAEVLRNEVLELQKQGTTIIFSTHDMNAAEKMCDFILMIFKGSKVLDGTLSAIKARYGQDTVRISCQGGAEFLADLEGVEKIRDFGHVQELRMKPSTDSQDVLKAIMQRTRVDSFEVTTPSLHDIFVRIADPQESENEDN
jgi:ABC-2 type transport system ATP-binding protein